MAVITAAAAGTWTLGDLTVNRMGFGAMRLTGGGRDSAISVLRKAVDLGVNHIDTAAFYISALRSANELINSALAPYPNDLVIATKVGPGKDASGAWLPYARPDQLRGQVEENLRQLGREYLDVVNLRVTGLDSLAEHFGALAELRDAGLVRHLGISNVQPHHLDEAQAIAPVVCVQNKYGIGAPQEEHDLLALCGERGVAYVPYFAIFGAKPESEEAVGSVARAHGVSAAQVRLAWTLRRGPHVLAIPGTGDPAHLEDNITASTLRLSEADLAQL